MPDANEAFTDFYEEKGKEYTDEFPWTYVVVVLSFIIILLVDKVLTSQITHSHDVDFDAKDSEKVKD